MKKGPWEAPSLLGTFFLSATHLVAERKKVPFRSDSKTDDHGDDREADKHDAGGPFEYIRSVHTHGITP